MIAGAAAESAEIGAEEEAQARGSRIAKSRAILRDLKTMALIYTETEKWTTASEST